MKVFSVILKDDRGSESGYVVAESIQEAINLAGSKRVTYCNEMGNLIAIQGTIEVSPVIQLPHVVETTPKRRGIAKWRSISGQG